MNTSSTFHLGLFGTPTLTASGGASLPAKTTQRHRLALMAMLARSAGAGSRDVLMAHLWPESDRDQARNLLKVSVYVLRQALGDGAVLSAGDGLRLAVDVVDVDTVAFDAALVSGDLEGAVSLYKGPFLEGFFLRDAPEFGHWMDRERATLDSGYAKALESLAEAAEEGDDRVASVEWWRLRAVQDPFDSRVALRLMRALARAGSRAGALQHARIHTSLLREELGIEPAAEFHDFVIQLRSEHEQAPGSASSDRVPTSSEPQRDERTAAGSARVDGSAVSGLSGDAASTPTGSALPPPSGVPRTRPRWATIGVSAGIASLVALVVFWAASRSSPRNADTIAEDIARAVVRQMNARGGERSTAQTVRPMTANVMAWELYRRAGQPEVLRSDSSAREALALVRRAVDLDPTFAGAHAGLARLYLRVGPPEDPDMPRVDRVNLARRHASRAVELDPSLGEGHATLGIADMSLYSFQEAEAHLETAVALDPNDGQAREWLVQLYVWMGRFDDALSEAERALESDPLSASARGELARALLVNGRCDEALAQLEHLRDLQPTLLRAGPIAAQCHAQRGLWEEAVSDVAEGLGRSGSHGRAAWAYFLARSGRRDEALEVLQEQLETTRSTGQDAFWVAMVYAGLGQLDEAFVWLDRAVDDHSLTYEVREPRFADLHADPRFPALLERLRLGTRG